MATRHEGKGREKTRANIKEGKRSKAQAEQSATRRSSTWVRGGVGRGGTSDEYLSRGNGHEEQRWVALMGIRYLIACFPALPHLTHRASKIEGAPRLARAACWG